jgi:diadenosine tetraphosphatase ApaH/serine/threonine PP2A family protein phosphatase
MQIYALWHGGSSYAVPTIPQDIERFDSIRAAREAFKARRDWDPYYPCVEGSSMYLYFSDPTGNPDPYPDRVLIEGPRGGLVEDPG